MMNSVFSGLPPPPCPRIIAARVATFAVLSLLATYVMAQQSEAKRDDLDVTMQILVDPDAKRPDEVVRRIVLPAPKPGGRNEPGDNKDQEKDDGQGNGKDKKQDAAATGQERASEARAFGREMSERNRERTREVTEQREEASRSVAEEHRNNGRPIEPPGRPPRN